MKPFDLKAAMNGDPIVTRNGEEAKFIAYVPEAEKSQQVLYLVGSIVYCRGVDGLNSCISPSSHDLFMAPDTIVINDKEVPRPEVNEPKLGQEIFIVDLMTDSGVLSDYWNRSKVQIKMLNRGCIHLYHEHADIHFKAIINANGGKE